MKLCDFFIGAVMVGGLMAQEAQAADDLTCARLNDPSDQSVLAKDLRQADQFLRNNYAQSAGLREAMALADQYAARAKTESFANFVRYSANVHLSYPRNIDMLSSYAAGKQRNSPEVCLAEDNSSYAYLFYDLNAALLSKPDVMVINRKHFADVGGDLFKRARLLGDAAREAAVRVNPSSNSVDLFMLFSRAP